MQLQVVAKNKFDEIFSWKKTELNMTIILMIFMYDSQSFFENKGTHFKNFKQGNAFSLYKTDTNLQAYVLV